MKIKFRLKQLQSVRFPLKNMGTNGENFTTPVGMWIMEITK
jgi:hypothetical protein